MKNSLLDFLGKIVIIEDTDGKIHKGYVDNYESAVDNEDPEEGIPKEESIGVIPFKGAREGIEFFESDIKSIRLAE